MPIKLMPLPYQPDALAPAISAETLATHHGKHHKAYVEKTNAMIVGTGLAESPLETVIAKALANKDEKLFNQAAQVWNHGFYWASLTPQKTRVSEELAKSIDNSFGSAQALQDQLVEEGAAHFGSGWLWLEAGKASLSIAATHDASQPAAGSTPLLVIDLWEHAYYLDRKQDRKAYLNAVIGKLDWGFASDNFARAERWTYPG